jgi:hypothetical protein
VIIVTGSHPHVPALPGRDGKPVMPDRDVLQARVEAGDRVVVVVDVHTQQGLSTAACLLEQGRHVEGSRGSCTQGRTSV